MNHARSLSSLKAPQKLSRLQQMFSLFQEIHLAFQTGHACLCNLHSERFRGLLKMNTFCSKKKTFCSVHLHFAWWRKNQKGNLVDCQYFDFIESSWMSLMTGNYTHQKRLACEQAPKRSIFFFALCATWEPVHRLGDFGACNCPS